MKPKIATLTKRQTKEYYNYRRQLEARAVDALKAGVDRDDVGKAHSYSLAVWIWDRFPSIPIGHEYAVELQA
jgi:hypothetical protein